MLGVHGMPWDVLQKGIQKMSILIKNGRVIDPDTRKDGRYDILIEEDKIVKVEQEIKEKEGQNIISHIKKDSYVIALDLTGKELDSVALSQKIENLSISNSSITFIIGGSLGLSNQVLNYCNEKLCFSKMTFPHQLIRVFLLEQLFRAFKISNNETYHW